MRCPARGKNICDAEEVMRAVLQGRVRTTSLQPLFAISTRTPPSVESSRCDNPATVARTSPSKFRLKQQRTPFTVRPPARRRSVLRCYGKIHAGWRTQRGKDHLSITKAVIRFDQADAAQFITALPIQSGANRVSLIGEDQDEVTVGCQMNCPAISRRGHLVGFPNLFAGARFAAGRRPPILPANT